MNDTTRSMELFDLAESERRKEQGMNLAEMNKLTDMQLARRVATDLAKKHPLREVNADDVFKVLANVYGIDSLGPASGSLFRGYNNWEFTGKRVKSSRKTNHAREIRVWRYIGEER